MSKCELKKIRYIFEYVGVMLLYGCVRVLPYGGVRILAALGGFVLYSIPPFRKLVSANLKVAFPEKSAKEIKSLTKSNLRHTALLGLELFWFRNHGDRTDRMVEFEDGLFEQLDKIDESGKGAIWVPLHMGNWELLGMRYQRARQPKFAVVVKRMKNPYLDDFVNTGRRSEGTRVIYSKGAVKEMMRLLRDRFFIATLIDQNTKARDGGVFVDFFGLPVPASRAPAMFARKMNVPVAVSCCVRGNRGMKIHISFIAKDSSEFESDEELTQVIMREVESFCRRFPEQYIWLYERWRHIPEDIDGELLKRYPYYASKVTPRFYDNKAPKEG